MSLISAPAANTFSPPYRITARTSSEPSADTAAAASSAVSWSFSALTGGRSSRIVPMPSATSSRTNSAISMPPGLAPGDDPLAAAVLARGDDPPDPRLAQVAVGHAGRRLGVGDQPELGAAVQQPVIGQHADRVA